MKTTGFGADKVGEDGIIPPRQPSNVKENHMTELTKLVDFSYDPKIVRKEPELNKVLGISAERMTELIRICETAREQSIEREEPEFNIPATFFKLVEADAFTPRELALYAILGFSARLHVRQIALDLLLSLADRDEILRDRLDFLANTTKGGDL